MYIYIHFFSFKDSSLFKIQRIITMLCLFLLYNNVNQMSYILTLLAQVTSP